MDVVTLRDLGRNADSVIDRVRAGERLTVVSSGRPAAELRPLPWSGLDAATLLERWSRLSSISPAELRDDIGRMLDSSL